MARHSRRTFLRGCLGAAAGAGLLGGTRPARAADRSPLGLAVLGKVEPRRAVEIEASPLSVGFETLDRKMFQPERTYGHLAGLGVKWARAQTGWARTETTKGRYDFGWLDGVVDSLRKIGVQPWFNLTYGNKLYTPEAPDASAVGWAPVFRPEAKDGWVRYTRAIAEHYAERVKHWEIWNEPNITNFWKPKKPSPADYVEMVKLTAPEIRRRAPGAVIVGGALAGMPLGYLEACMKLGLGEHVDRISYHPYRPVPEKGYDEQVRTFRELLARYNSKIKLWQGENGCPSQKGSSGALRQYDWNETRQARWLLRRILTDLRLGIELTSYFHLVDLVNYNWGSGPSGQTNFKGLLRGTDYTPKPSYFAYQCLCALFDAETKRADAKIEFGPSTTTAERVEAEQIHHAAFLRRGRRLWVYWYPATLQEDFAAQPVGVKVTAEGEAELREPVLVDPLRSQVLKVEADNEGPGRWRMPALPLTDYPLIVTDRSVVL